MLDYHAGVEIPFSPTLDYVLVTQEFGEGNPNRNGFDHGKTQDKNHQADAYLYYAVDIAIARK
jgi:hypothetical protein